MPLLVYSYPDFTPHTVILSAQVNAKYNDIRTLLNTTKLDDDNIQNDGITRASKLKPGSANYVLINDGSGEMSEEVYLATTRGGLGTSLTLTPGDANKYLQVNSGGTAIGLNSSAESAAVKFYALNRYV